LAPGRQLSLFELAPESELSSLLIFATELAAFCPEVLSAIDRDRDAHALQKKLRRLEQKQWIDSQTRPLLQTPLVQQPEPLKSGRPRMDALCVLAFELMRGWLGGAKSARFQAMVTESTSLRIFLENRGAKMPAPSTVEENLSVLSPATQKLILQSQLALARAEGLDDFKNLRIDSTHCQSASAYPTDSGTLTKLIARLCASLGQLNKLDLAVAAEPRLLVWPAQLRKLNYRICTLTSSSARQAEKAQQAEQIEQADPTAQAKEPTLPPGRPLSAKERLRIELYLELYAQALEALEVIDGYAAEVQKAIGQGDPSPAILCRRRHLAHVLGEDIAAARRVIQCSRARVCEGRAPVAKDHMLLSLSDVSAAFIEKGGWERAFGYRPQIAFSGRGLVTALLVPEGNLADQCQAGSIVAEAIANTKVVPYLASFDDGYSSAASLAEVRAQGIEVVSFSGARGKALLGQETWEREEYQQARRERNGAESGIFYLKERVGLEQLSNFGLAAVQREVMEKVLAANALKIALLRSRQQTLTKRDDPARSLKIA
jgi:hypothetical protein